MKYIAPDTNFILHFRTLCDINPEADLDVSGQTSWLIAQQVLKELEIRKGTGEKRLRARAREAVRSFELAESGEKPFSQPLIAHLRSPGFDFAHRHLDPQENDDKVIADLIDFRTSHTTDDVLLLTDDYGMRLRARRHGIDVLRPRETLRREEIEDDRDRRIRELEALAKDQPDLDLLLGGATETTAEVFTFEEGELEVLIAEKMEPAKPNPLFAWLQQWETKNENYETQLEGYGNKYREYFNRSWTYHERTVAVMPDLRSKGGVQAKDVTISLTFETRARVLEHVEGPPKPPPRPSPTKSLSKYGIPNPAAALLYKANGVDFSPRDPRRPRIEQQGSSVSVRYRLPSVPQEATTELEPFHLAFDNEVEAPQATCISYEVRAENMRRVVRGSLILRLAVKRKPLPATYSLD